MELEDFQRDYADFLLSDELEQFRSGEVTRAVLKAKARQFGDLLASAKELATQTSIDAAVGAQLDGCGDIVRLTRAQAGMLSNEVTTDITTVREDVLDAVKTPLDVLQAHQQYGLIPFDVIDDARYREYLWFKVFLNTNKCTMYDVLKALKFFWTRSRVRYIEGPIINGQRHHAAILLRSLDSFPGTDNSARLFFLLPIIKAAGVLLLREATTVTEMRPAELRAKPVVTGTAARVAMPRVTIEL